MAAFQLHVAIGAKPNGRYIKVAVSESRNSESGITVSISSAAGLYVILAESKTIVCLFDLDFFPC